MSNKAAQDHLSTRSHRLVAFLCYLLILVVGLRRRYDLVGGFTVGLLIALLAVFTLLYTSETWVSRRMKSYYRLYLVMQVVIVLSVGAFQEYQDTWALLYIILGFQVAQRCSRKEAVVWYILFATSLLVTLGIEFGVISGPGRALAYVIIGVLMISYDIQYSEHEDSLAESQLLVAELQEANRKLADYAVKAEELAALQERNRMIQELYDSVGQKIFAIQLATETTRLTLAKNPMRAEKQIEDLQVQTQSALGQVRQLIDQWRPS
jgi:signal transduction histidine kinase